MLLSFDRLLENRLAAAILLAHGLGRSLHVGERLGLDGCSMGNYGARCGINFQHRVATGAGHFEVRGSLRHLSESYRKTAESGLSFTEPIGGNACVIKRSVSFWR